MATQGSRDLISILCKMWYEDGVWNAEAVDLPIAVFGETIEDVKNHLYDAIFAHLETAAALGEFNEIIEAYERRKRIKLINLKDIKKDSIYDNISFPLNQELKTQVHM